MALTTTSLENIPLIAKGKVRDIYSIPSDPKSLLFVATDRVFPYLLKLI
jgi:phosphoribosylaminoimidazole-succinocarboxamide synthase